MEFHNLQDQLHKKVVKAEKEVSFIKGFLVGFGTAIVLTFSIIFIFHYIYNS